jgi:hypothetical protein
MLASLCSRGIARKTAGSALKSVLDLENESLLLKKYIAKNRLEGGFENKRERKRLLKYEGFSEDAVEMLDDE